MPTCLVTWRSETVARLSSSAISRAASRIACRVRCLRSWRDPSDGDDTPALYRSPRCTPEHRTGPWATSPGAFLDHTPGMPSMVSVYGCSLKGMNAHEPHPDTAPFTRRRRAHVTARRGPLPRAGQPDVGRARGACPRGPRRAGDARRHHAHAPPDEHLGRLP